MIRERSDNHRHRHTARKAPLTAAFLARLHVATERMEGEQRVDLQG